jgi:hypothetical protein
MLLGAAASAAVTPYPPFPGAVPSEAYEVTVDGRPVFVNRYLTYDQFNWMDYASFSMTGKVRVTVTLLVSERRVHTCQVRPLAYGIQPTIDGNTVTFELDRPRYLVLFLNEQPSFYSTGLMLFAEPPEKNPPRLGDANVVNIQDYKVDGTGKTVETAKINQAISDVSARPGGGVLFFPAGAYLTGTLFVKSNVKLYVDAGAVILGSTKSADYTSAAAAPGERQRRAMIIFNNVENAGLMGRGAIDMQGYPWLWHDFQPDTSDGHARDADGKVIDPHGPGIRGYVVNNSRNISFQDLLLLRGAYWTVHVIDTEYFSTRNIKIVSRKQQYHDDAYDFSGSKHILIEDGFAMTMDDTWALYRGRDSRTGEAKGIEDFAVKGFVNYTYTAGLAIGYGGAPAVKHLRFEDVHFITNHNKYAIWIQLTPVYFTGRGYAAGSRPSQNAPLEDFRFVRCTFENDGGHVYIDGGDQPLTNFAFEDCTFYFRATRPDMLMGHNAGPVLFKNVKMNGAVVRDAEQLKQGGFDVLVPVKFEP